VEVGKPVFDCILRNGTVIDGTRQPRFAADVGIRQDRIAAIGHLENQPAKLVLDVSGKVVAPGFIDVHTHSDGLLLRSTNLVPKTTQGFSSEVLMLDGISYAPVSTQNAAQWFFYLRALDGLRLDEYRGWHSIADYMQLLHQNTAQNTVALIPYANVRALACGFGRSRIDDFQRLVIADEIQRGMASGAVGISTGLDYIVQCHADTDELVDACRAMAPVGGVYVTHVRYKLGLLPALNEAIDIARRSGVALHISHLKAVGKQTVEDVWTLLDQSSRDVDITFDVYPYMSGSTMLNYLLPYDVWENGPLSAIAKLQCPEIRLRFAAGLNQYKLKLDRIRIAWVAGAENKHHQGKTLAAYVASCSCEPADALANLLIEERLAVLLVLNEGDDPSINPILQHDAFMMGSDGIYFSDGHVHPRVFGSATRLLGPLVRDAKLFSLEDAVFKMTSLPARRFGFSQRGIVRESYFADLVVFDPRTVGDRATYENPQQPSVGIEQLLVNGVFVIRDGAPVEFQRGAAPGRWVLGSPES